MDQLKRLLLYRLRILNIFNKFQEIYLIQINLKKYHYLLTLKLKLTSKRTKKHDNNIIINLFPKSLLIRLIFKNKSSLFP